MFRIIAFLSVIMVIGMFIRCCPRIGALLFITLLVGWFGCGFVLGMFMLFIVPLITMRVFSGWIERHTGIALLMMPVFLYLSVIWIIPYFIGQICQGVSG